MSWTLGIDSSTVELGVALVHDHTAVASCSRYIVNSHAEHIDKAIHYLLEGNNLTAGHIARVGIAAGPGSFTGLRIGLAFAKGMFFDSSARILPLSSLESAARCYLPVLGNATMAVAFDARRGDVYWARFACQNGQITRLSDDTLTSFDLFAAALQAQDCIITDTLGYAKSCVFDTLAHVANHRIAIEQVPPQRGLACALAAATASESDPRWCQAPDALPEYIRLSAPEERSTTTGR